jgi:hypothetical protein
MISVAACIGMVRNTAKDFKKLNFKIVFYGL